ncbi:MAG: AraC family transcriptional regulator [Chitinophagales bacterium]|nr:AraC family transcriptional regulator [Chitinophagales bacterium]
MNNETQLKRYKKLLAFIDENFKNDINIQKIETVCHYSYRNINRIFEAIHHETIGKYIKRLRLEKSAQYLLYSEMGISDIGYEVGFENRTAFSKAFKKKYGCSPSAFRINNEALLEMAQQSLLYQESTNRQKLQFEITYLSDFEYIILEYRGSYKDVLAIEKVANQLYDYAKDKEILTKQSKFITEIIDDSGISDSIHLRYNMALTLEKPLKFEPEGFFRLKTHKRQKYAKFVHKGTLQKCMDFYNEIYTFWMLDVGLELVDRPTLEFYPNYDEDSLPDDMLTEIYIPVN